MGSQIPFDQQELAGKLAGVDHLFEISGGDSQSHLYDQRDRSGESVTAQDQQEPWGFPQSGIGAQAVLAGAGADCQEVDDAGPQLERSAQPICLGIWRQDAAAERSPMNPKSKSDSTAGGASRGSPLAPCSFYLANTFELVQQQKPKQNHLHEYLYKTPVSVSRCDPAALVST